MRPHRLELTNQLVLAYGLHNRMSMHSPRKATEEELLAVHDQDYLAFLKRYVCILTNTENVVPRLGKATTSSRNKRDHFRSEKTRTVHGSRACLISVNSMPEHPWQQRGSLLAKVPTLRSTGVVGYIMPSGDRLVAFATSTTLSWQYCNSYGELLFTTLLTQGPNHEYYISTLMFITEMGSNTPFINRIAS
jgi:hypothetical protein